jgi:hypothetical protein
MPEVAPVTKAIFPSKVREVIDQLLLVGVLHGRQRHQVIAQEVSVQESPQKRTPMQRRG